MFQGLRFRLLASYLSVMAAILSFFSLWVSIRFTYGLFQQSQQLDDKLKLIAQTAAADFSEVETKGNDYLKKYELSEEQSIEWFDEDKQMIASKGGFTLSFPPQTEHRLKVINLDRKSLPIRFYTLAVFNHEKISDPSTPDGYIRVSQTTENITTVQNQLLSQLTTGILFSLILSGVGGFWLTKKATTPVEETYQNLKQFTADASHELRNPLTAISTSIEVMLNHPERIHPKDVKKLAAIAKATEHMTRLTQDLLFLARTDGEIALVENPWQSISLNQILENLIDLLEPLAEDKEVKLNYEALTTVSVMGDPSQLSRLFSNLLQNAIQYTPPKGQVTLSLTKQNRLCYVSVQDTGIGIAPEELPFIFNRFWRADKARTRREGGSGLGLSIVAAIAQRHGGKITVSSEVGVGSCFKVQLPIYYGT
ncbi:sensor histidine kinase [Gloeothece verrucosa]|uniref:histidine kinase n=1 Tax=Gloeothece verrucosa (strain PCC 7822) TaxID=497965 RepID=E0UF34_GLOV7|nr:HAMP domain-containing sensor histidine kinase [Gloeothece verrucosa]ADN14286.1 histidine kinase [Gloeothece verrucosa PCC 7822]